MTFTSPLSSFYCVLNVDFRLLCMFFPPQHVAAHNLSAKGEVSFPLAWIGRFFREKKQWIISAVAEGCREVVWHRHWLSLLRSEGIVRPREKKKKERKGAKWVSKWTKLQIGLDEMQVSWGCAGFLFFYFYIFLQHVVQVGPAISHAFLTPDRQGRGWISRSQISKRRQN